MAETYETGIYGGQGKPQTGSGQPTLPGAPATAQTGGEKYETPIYNQGQTGGDQGGGQQTTAAQPQQTTGGASQPADWSIDWSKGGEVKLPQSVQDWGNVAGNEAAAASLPDLRAQAEAARKRLDPATAASADFAGALVSPTQLLNAVPGVGPELAGGVHEGVKSAVANWKPDESWGQYLKNVGEDTAGGVAAGFGGQMTGLAAQKALPELIKMGVVTGGATVGHKLLGGGLVPDLGKELPGLFGIYKGVDKLADWAGEKGKDLLSTPAAQQAIKSLFLAGGSAARNAAGPGFSYDQWIPGQ